MCANPLELNIRWKCKENKMVQNKNGGFQNAKNWLFNFSNKKNGRQQLQEVKKADILKGMYEMKWDLVANKFAQVKPKLEHIVWTDFSFDYCIQHFAGEFFF